MHNMFLSGADFWGRTWIRRTSPFREARVLTPLTAFPCMLYETTKRKRKDTTELGPLHEVHIIRSNTIIKVSRVVNLEMDAARHVHRGMLP
jgi:hypothetical protein